MVLKYRYFIVGCPRSGTTLLQSLLASHSTVNSFPESHFFCNLFGDYEPKRRMLGIASRRIYPRIQEFLKELGQENQNNYLPRNLIFANQYTSFFIHLLDRLTIEKSKKIWIEKTPPHLHYIDYIEQKVVGACFIHIVRNGADVAASIYDLRNRYPSIWDGNKNQISDCINRWIEDFKITLKHIEKPNHYCIRYENLITNTESELVKLCQFMKLQFEPKMLTGYSYQAKKVSLSKETWKESVGEKIQNKQQQKFKEVLSLAEQKYLLQQLKEWNLDEFFTSDRLA